MRKYYHTLLKVIRRKRNIPLRVSGRNRNVRLISRIRSFFLILILNYVIIVYEDAK